MFKFCLFIFGLVMSFALTCDFVTFLTKDNVALVTIPLDLPRLNVPIVTSVDPKELRCLQENIYFEGRNQNVYGQAMIGFVTLARTKMVDFPSTICGVVHDHAQFSWTLKKIKPNLKDKIEREAWDLAGVIANNILWNAPSIDNDYKNLAYYHTLAVKPRWAKSPRLQREFVIGDHVFYSQVGNNVTSQAPSFVLR